MFPGMPKIDPKKMQGMLKQMGINQQEVDAQRVIIETPEKKIVIENPSVQKITMQGQISFQVSGDVSEEANEEFSDEDVKLVAEKTNSSEEEARQALEESNGDIAEAIVKLSE